MSYLLDTDVAIHLRDLTPGVVAHFSRMSEPPAISLITLVELEGGVYAVPRFVAARRSALEQLLLDLELKPFDDTVVRIYGQIVRSCGFSRRRILDRLIAATAISNQSTLVTMNSADFSDIPGLKLESWDEPAQ